MPCASFRPTWATFASYAGPVTAWLAAVFLVTAPVGSASEGFRDAAPFALDRAPGTAMQAEGWVRRYLDAVTSHWLVVAPASNPALLDMLRDRNRRPLRELLPWSGEFAGKHLLGAVQVHRVTRDPTLRESIARLVGELISIQRSDGYLGPWPDGTELTGHSPNSFIRGVKKTNSDAWGHYFLMLGFLLWAEDTGDQAAFAAARRIGDLLCTAFRERRFIDMGGAFTEMNLAPIHSLALLYRRTGETRYLRLAERIRDEFHARSPEGKPLAGDYFLGPLGGKLMHQLPKNRWEGLHPIMGFSELYAGTGDVRYRTALETIWWGIVQWDRHNNGGFSSKERAVGNPYHTGPIETCCTVAWLALGVEMLRLTGNPVVADELELATLNAILGAHSPTGRWSTYDTPMNGVRKASTQDIAFQATPGGAELNCCSVNAARGLGLIGEWAAMTDPQGAVLNWYGPGTLHLPLQDGNRLTLRQHTTYPHGSRVRLEVLPARPTRLVLKLRIPSWSHRTQVTLNGSRLPRPAAGSYLSLDRDWRGQDTIEFEFDFALQFWVGEREFAGLTSIYRGPLLLAYDRRFNSMDPDDLPPLVARTLVERTPSTSPGRPPFLLLEFTAADGRAVRLCDFASAGDGGSPYRSWLNLEGATGAEFSRINPRRTASANLAAETRLR